MMLYDTLEDCRSKLLGTYVYYKGRASIVKTIDSNEAGDNFILGLGVLGSRTKTVAALDDPDLNFMRYTLGYSNHNHSAVWWYRLPIKQYQQGLKNGQVSANASKEEYLHRVEFGYSDPIVRMLENKYPTLDEAEKMLKDQQVTISAFHRDFACSWDRIHKDMILEYKGRPIGYITKKGESNIMDEYAHLTEAFNEARG